MAPNIVAIRYGNGIMTSRELKFGIKQKILLVLISVLALTTLLHALLASYFTNRQNRESAFAALSGDLLGWRQDLQASILRLREVALAAVGEAVVLGQLSELVNNEFMVDEAVDPELYEESARTLAYGKTVFINRLLPVLRSGGFSSIAVYTTHGLSHYVSASTAGMTLRRQNADPVWVTAVADARGNLPTHRWPAWPEGIRPVAAGMLPAEMIQPFVLLSFPDAGKTAIEIVIPVQGELGYVVVDNLQSDAALMPMKRLVSDLGLTNATAVRGDSATPKRLTTLAILVFRKLIDRAALEEVKSRTGAWPALFSADGSHRQQLMSFELSAAQLQNVNNVGSEVRAQGMRDTISTEQGSFYAVLLPWQFELQPPLILGMASSRDITLQNIRETVAAILAAAAVILLLSIAVGVFGVRRFIDPIVALTTAVKGIALSRHGGDRGSGNTLEELRLVKVDARDEVGELARAFNAMIAELQQSFETLEQRVEDRTKDLEDAHRQLLEVSRMAGMAEIATNVLHNVGNVLNSVNVSANVVSERIQKSEIAGLAQAVTLMRKHEADLARYLTEDSRGKHLTAYLAQLSEHLQSEQEASVNELKLLRQSLDHINEIVAMQQTYAGVSGVTDMVDIGDLVEESLRLDGGENIKIVREIEDLPPVNFDKHKLMQILLNLLRNARGACEESGRIDPCITLRVAESGGRITVAVADNGVGIPAENLTRIFNHGFTTKKGGHGFGLHSAALAAKQMGGSLQAESDGPGQGASFTLELPLNYGKAGLT